MNPDAIVIIGASAAGVSAAKEIRAIDETVPVVVFSDERDRPYYRPILTEYIGDNGVEKRPGFFLNPEAWYGEKKIELRLGERVTRIDHASMTVRTSHGGDYPYGKLIIASGSEPFVPFPDALSMENVFAIRTLADARAVIGCADGASRVIVIGGGMLGLEAAHSLAARGLGVTVIEASDRILPRQLDAECSAIASEIISKKDIELILGKSIASIPGGSRAEGVRLSTGEEIGADMIIFSVGVRPSTELAGGCGMGVNRAIVVNDRMETSIPGVYACGDAAEFNGRNIALWMSAVRQGKTAGSNAAGRPARLEEDVYPAVLNLFGTRLFSAGDLCHDRKEWDYRACMIKDGEKAHYRKLFFVDDRLSGFILIGAIADSKRLLDAMKKGSSFEELTGEGPGSHG